VWCRVGPRLLAWPPRLARRGSRQCADEASRWTSGRSANAEAPSSIWATPEEDQLTRDPILRPISRISLLCLRRLSLPCGELRSTLLEARVLVERWRRHYNTVRPHSSLGYRPPAPEAIQPCPPGSATPPPTGRAETDRIYDTVSGTIPGGRSGQSADGEQREVDEERGRMAARQLDERLPDSESADVMSFLSGECQGSSGSLLSPRLIPSGALLARCQRAAARLCRRIGPSAQPAAAHPGDALLPAETATRCRGGDAVPAPGGGVGAGRME
jgi:hypothetical protein